MLLSFGVSAIAARVFARVGCADPVTAFFATSVGGGAEMANLAERYGARVDQVAAAQALRVLTVALVLPLLFRFADLHGSDLSASVAVPVAWRGLGILLASCGVAGAVLHLCACRTPDCSAPCSSAPRGPPAVKPSRPCPHRWSTSANG